MVNVSQFLMNQPLYISLLAMEGTLKGSQPSKILLIPYYHSITSQIASNFLLDCCHFCIWDIVWQSRSQVTQLSENQALVMLSSRSRIEHMLTIPGIETMMEMLSLPTRCGSTTDTGRLLRQLQLCKVSWWRFYSCKQMTICLCEMDVILLVSSCGINNLRVEKKGMRNHLWHCVLSSQELGKYINIP